MEVVLVQLTDEAGKITVLEVLGKDVLGKFFALPAVSISPQRRGCETDAHLQDNEAGPVIAPSDRFRV